MSTDPTNTPDTWGLDGVFRVPGSPEPGVFAMHRPVGAGRPPGDGIVIWHWHTPNGGDARWQAAGCGLHTVVSLDPLHLEPSLACEGGCPNHGYIRDGQWVSV